MPVGDVMEVTPIQMEVILMSPRRLWKLCLMMSLVLVLAACAKRNSAPPPPTEEAGRVAPSLAEEEKVLPAAEPEAVGRLESAARSVAERFAPAIERPAELAAPDAVAVEDAPSDAAYTGADRPAPTPAAPSDGEAQEAASQAPEIEELPSLQAGQSDDNHRFSAFRDFLADYQPEHAGLVRDRTIVTVRRADGSPVHGAVIALDPETPGREVVLRTGSDGHAYLYAGLYDVQTPIRARVQCPQGRQAAEETQSQTVTLTGEETAVELRCARPQAVTLDVVFLHDVTGSMSDEMAQLRLTTEGVMAKLAEAYGQSPAMIRVGGVLYRDRGDDFVTRRIDFASPDGFIDHFRQYGANGGGDTPESVNAGLDEALRMDWRADAVKVVILIGDAAPHGYWDDPWDRYLDLIQRGVQQGVRLHAISASGMDDRGEVAWREMAAFSGGKYVFLTYESDAESQPGSETRRHVEDGYNVSDLGSIIFSLLKQEIETQLSLQ